jgi:RNA polymerase sigma-70 factor (sigma-E family)
MTLTRDTPPQTFEEYAAARAAVLHRTAYLLTGSRQDAEDLVQVTLIKVLLAWSKVSEAGSPDAYARRILVNAFISGRRPARYTRERLVVELPETPVTDPDPTDRLTLWPHVVALPPRQRAVVVLRYYSGLSEAEISDVLGIARGTVKSTAAAALATLRTRMGDLS